VDLRTRQPNGENSVTACDSSRKWALRDESRSRFLAPLHTGHGNVVGYLVTAMLHLQRRSLARLDRNAALRLSATLYEDKRTVLQWS
jgi:hypothetical protein